MFRNTNTNSSCLHNLNCILAILAIRQRVFYYIHGLFQCVFSVQMLNDGLGFYIVCKWVS